MNLGLVVSGLVCVVLDFGEFPVGLYTSETVVGLCFKDFLSEVCFVEFGFCFCCLFLAFALSRLGCYCLRWFVLLCDLYLLMIDCLGCDFDDGCLRWVFTYVFAFAFWWLLVLFGYLFYCVISV